MPKPRACPLLLIGLLAFLQSTALGSENRPSLDEERHSNRSGHSVTLAPPPLEEPSGDATKQIDSLLSYWQEHSDARARAELWKRARNLAATEDARIIPVMIGVIDADNSYDTIYGLGYFGLSKVTGVPYSPYHDGGWWRRWWAANKEKFPQAAQAIAIPELEKTSRGRAYTPMPESFETFDGKIAWLHQTLKEGRDVAFDDWARALVSHRDPRAIPTLIGLIEADNTYRTIYGVGHFGIGAMTDVRYDAAHDGAWWRQWWEEHKARYSEAAQQTPIPDLKAEIVAWTAGEKDREKARQDAEFAGFPCLDLLAGGDDRMRYFLIGPAEAQQPPAEGWKLLLILPGGPGTADFQEFCRTIHRDALPNGFIAAELVAPQWSDNPNRTVWPTRMLNNDNAAFTTEDFIRAVVSEVSKRHAIDRKHVLALGWSSSGPALYCDSLQADTPVMGWFVAMSVFRPEWMPPLDAAKGHRYYILHSPQDTMIPIAVHAKVAADRLGAAGADVTLVEYQGGHGWTEDPIVTVRRGIDWLVAERR